jgi:hypothetical protein
MILNRRSALRYEQIRVLKSKVEKSGTRLSLRREAEKYRAYQTIHQFQAHGRPLSSIRYTNQGYNHAMGPCTTPCNVEGINASNPSGKISSKGCQIRSSVRPRQYGQSKEGNQQLFMRNHSNMPYVESLWLLANKS